ncbi:hypothetical protein SmJEL517_g05381 [Synchytrium microbalum]|uniref:Uncharacterized protein n=1 Tax=Synchytrium microbalum TaxID=1806994 RepID=A0A507C160_9FUNG|nr:uncharacterized protein SmJEL517_g05381 [Synchytrium microbalum]TPX31243.1 hypothetical protein SmJEL517_g05381 [Synchytrium microbalum]
MSSSRRKRPAVSEEEQSDQSNGKPLTLFTPVPNAKVVIVHKMTKIDTLKQIYGDTVSVVDVTSKSSLPYVKFSPFYPWKDGIPIATDSSKTAVSVEGIWQGLKVFENEGISTKHLQNDTMQNVKRSATRLRGKVLGHSATVTDEITLLEYIDARKQIYLPAYKYVLDNYLQKEVALLANMVRELDTTLCLKDYTTNSDVDDVTQPLSHASLIAAYIKGQWPN